MKQISKTISDRPAVESCVSGVTTKYVVRLKEGYIFEDGGDTARGFNQVKDVFAAKPVKIAAPEKPVVDMDINEAFTKAYDHFNESLFAGSLPKCGNCDAQLEEA